jgi:hypothetical protein
VQQGTPTKRARALAMFAAVSCVALGGPIAATASATSTRTRSCGSIPNAAPNHVRASPGVSCRLAKKMMKKLLVGSQACYPHGFTSTPHCRLYGFRCSAHPTDSGHATHGRCVKGRNLVTGVAYG